MRQGMHVADQSSWIEGTGWFVLFAAFLHAKHKLTHMLCKRVHA